MEQHKLLKRYLWLVDLIYRNEGISREDINRAWRKCSVNTDNEYEISERQFHRHKKAIKELFDIDIVCCRSGGVGYRIAQPEELWKNNIKSWLLNCFSIGNILHQSYDLSNRILLENVPSGQEYLTQLIEAMREGFIVDIMYQSYRMNSPASHIIEPYCIKVYKQRWYVIGRRVDTQQIRTFALDRIKSIVRTSEKFEYPSDFDGEEFFANSVGIIVDEKMPAQRVVIRAYNGQQDYIRSLPFHSSQEEIARDADSSTFDLYVSPTYDLIQELLRYGESIEVVSPKWLRDEFCAISKKMSDRYK